MDNRKLIEFIVSVFGGIEVYRFVIYGSFSFNENLVPNFENVEIKKIKDGKEEDIEWNDINSERITEKYAESVLSAIIRHDSRVLVLYLHDTVQNFIKEYETDIAFEHNGRKILKHYYSRTNGRCELFFATDSILYYSGENITAICIENCRIVSEHFFAKIALSYSIDAVEKGEETILYGEIPYELNSLEENLP